MPINLLLLHGLSCARKLTRRELSRRGVFRVRSSHPDRPTQRNFPMSRLIPALLAGSLFFAVTTARAADAPAGSWKLTLGNGAIKILITLDKGKDGKWTGKVLGSSLEE